jgi:SAM-dependent methyltransferase
MNTSAGNQFDRGAHWYRDSTPWVRDSELTRLMVSALARHVPRGVCADVGAGGCDVARAALDDGIGPWLCFDTSFAMLNSVASPGLWRVQAEGVRLPLRRGSVAGGICRSALHYVGARRGLAEWRRVLVDGGCLVLAQKVADNVEPEIDWYLEVQRLRSVVPREWYYGKDLLRYAQEAGMEVLGSTFYRGLYEADVDTWASRRGVLAPSVASRLRKLTERGFDPEFADRIGFRRVDNSLRMQITWHILVCGAGRQALWGDR